MGIRAQAELLISARKKANLSQSDISKALRLSSPQFISNIERGLVHIPPNRLAQFARLTRTPAEDFIRAHLADYESQLRENMKS